MFYWRLFGNATSTESKMFFEKFQPNYVVMLGATGAIIPFEMFQKSPSQFVKISSSLSQWKGGGVVHFRRPRRTLHLFWVAGIMHERFNAFLAMPTSLRRRKDEMVGDCQVNVRPKNVLIGWPWGTYVHCYIVNVFIVLKHVFLWFKTWVCWCCISKWTPPACWKLTHNSLVFFFFFFGKFMPTPRWEILCGWRSQWWSWRLCWIFASVPFATRTWNFLMFWTFSLVIWRCLRVDFLLAFFWGENLNYAKAAPEEGARVDCAWIAPTHTKNTSTTKVFSKKINNPLYRTLI